MLGLGQRSTMTTYDLSLGFENLLDQSEDK